MRKEGSYEKDEKVVRPVTDLEDQVESKTCQGWNMLTLWDALNWHCEGAQLLAKARSRYESGKGC